MIQSEKARPGAQAPDVHPKAAAASWPVVFARSAVGKKWLMALSGIAMLGFVLAHMVGNLKVYLGEEDLNHYAEFLRELLSPLVPHGWMLWIMRIGLLGALIIHVWAAATLTVTNRRANATKYQSPRDYQAVNFASKTMRYTGVWVVFYLIFHLLDLTWGRTGADFEHGDVYDNLITSMERWPVALFYILSSLVVSLHLYHGAWSMFQSMGFNNPRYNPARRVFAVSIAAILAVGNVSIPIAIVTGAVG